MEKLTFAKARGDLLHRAALHPGGSWFKVDSDDGRTRYAEESLHLGARLEEELAKDDFGFAADLVSHAGPAWGRRYMKRIRNDLSEAEQRKLGVGLIGPLSGIVENLMWMAENANWHRVRTEVDSCVSVLRGDPFQAARIDLVVERLNREPLLIDLKTTQTEKVSVVAADGYVAEVAIRYGAWLANAVDDDVICRVVMARSDKKFVKWSEGPGVTVSATDVRLDEHERLVAARAALISEGQSVSGASLLGRAYPAGSDAKWGRTVDEAVCDQWLSKANFQSYARA